jgi:hypothetical protein
MQTWVGIKNDKRTNRVLALECGIKYPKPFEEKTSTIHPNMFSNNADLK